MKQKIDKNKKFLIIVATHGDESFSIPVIETLKKTFPDKFDFIIGNPKALQRNKRFIDADLNRVAPGKKSSGLYEVRRACTIMKKAVDYQFVLDIHGTFSQSSIFTIVTNPTPTNINLAYFLPIDRIVIWGSKNNGRKTGPLSRFISRGIEIECGSKNSVKTRKELYNKLTSFLDSNNRDYESMDNKELYQIFGSLKKGEIERQEEKKLKDFQEIIINNQAFFPLLVNQYKDEKIICYKMKKLNFYEKFSFPY